MLLKKVLLGTVASALALSAFVSTAKAQTPCGDRPYVAVRTGLAMLKNHIDKNAWEGGAAVGMQLNEFRAELEYTYRDGIEGDYIGAKHKVDTMSLMVNGYYDIQTGSALHPFVNLGIGASRIKIKDVGISSDSYNKFSWGGGVGVGYDLSKNITFDLGYRFLDLGKEIKSNEFYGGLRFAF
ncbi:MAG: porin family protein [Alphaproteobacteria bacterium]|nr:porin family protein [Alphaproteobacteria bacterium]